MHHSIPTKLLSLFLAVSLLIGCFPAAFAAQTEETGEPTAITTEPETTAPTETEAASTEDPTQPATETVPEDGTVPGEATAPGEETVPS